MRVSIKDSRVKCIKLVAFWLLIRIRLVCDCLKLSGELVMDSITKGKQVFLVLLHSTLFYLLVRKTVI